MAKNLQNPPCFVDFDGFFWVFGGAIPAKCHLDLTFFPFDKQKCGLEFENWAYTSKTVELGIGPNPFHMTMTTPNGEWQIDNTDTEKQYIDVIENEKPTVHFSSLVFTLYLTRKSLYYVINLVSPCLMMMALTLAMFWLPPDSGEKVSLGKFYLVIFCCLGFLYKLHLLTC